MPGNVLVTSPRPDRPRCDAHGHEGETPSRRHGRPASDHIAVRAFDLVKDALVETEGGPDTGSRAGRKQIDPGCRRSIVGPCAAYLVRDKALDLRRRGARGDRGGQAGVGHAESTKVLLWQVDAPATEILRDIADEVRELERAT